MSLAAGPIGRNAEAAGAASLKSVAAIFSYSKTKGLFAGVSLEGSAIIERKDANTKLYGRPISARELLTGSEPSPPQAAPLLNILNSRAFNTGHRNSDDTYNDIPVYDDQYDNNSSWGNRRGNAYGDGQTRDSGYGSPSWDRDRERNRDDGYGGGGGGGGGGMRRSATTSWRDDAYDNPGNRGFNNASRSNTFNDAGSGAKSAGPGRPAAPKPNFASKQALLKKNEAVALFTFEADQPGDLAFKKGDVITVLKKTDSDNDWW